MKIFYLIQVQNRNPQQQQQPSAPIVVERQDLVKFINEMLKDDIVVLISHVAHYE